MYKISSPIKRLSATLIDIVSFLLIVAIILLVALVALYSMDSLRDVTRLVATGGTLPTTDGVFGFLTEPINIPLFDLGYWMIIDPPMSITAGVLGAIVFSYLLYFIIVPAVGPNQTIGRVVTGTQVVTADGEKMSIAAIFIREFVGNFLLTVTLIGILLNLVFVFGDKNMTISDVLSKSALVDIPEPTATKVKSSDDDTEKEDEKEHSEDNNDEDGDEKKEKKKKKEKPEKKVKEKKQKKKKGEEDSEENSDEDSVSESNEAVT